MTDENQIFTWVIAGVGAIGGLVARDRQMMKKITDGDADNEKSIGKVKDDMNANFARKDDVKEAVRRLERGMENISAEMKQNHQALTDLIIKRGE